MQKIIFSLLLTFGMSAFAELTAVPNIAPHTGGKVDGYRVIDQKGGSPTEQVGLLPGDKMKSIDGKEITSPAQAMDAYNKMRTKSFKEIRVSRGGKEVIITPENAH